MQCVVGLGGPEPPTMLNSGCAAPDTAERIFRGDEEIIVPRKFLDAVSKMQTIRLVESDGVLRASNTASNTKALKESNSERRSRLQEYKR